MSSNFETMAVNGIDVQVWRNATQAGRAEGRRLASHLPRGGDYGEGTIRRIESPSRANANAKVWLAGDGYVQFEVPDGYEVETVSGFESPGTCITLKRVE